MVKTLLALVLLLAVTIGAGIAYLTSGAFSERAGGWASEKSGRRISLAEPLQIHWGREPRVTLTGLRIKNADWAKEEDMFSAARIEFSFRPWELLRGRLVLPEVILERPRLALEKDGKERANWHFSENAAAEALKAPAPENRHEFPVIGHLRIAEGKILYADAKKHIDSLLNISTAQGQAEADERIVVTSKGSYKGGTFKLEMSGASVLQLRDEHAPYPLHIKATVGPTHIEAEGAIDDPIKMTGLDLALDLRGEDASDLFDITGIVLPVTPPYHVKGRLTTADNIWTFKDFAGTMGNSDLSGRVSLDKNRKPSYLKGEFRSNNLDMKDLAGFIGADKKPADPDRVIPDKELKFERFQQMDADITLRGEHIKIPDLLDNFVLEAHAKGGVVRFDPISFGLAKGVIKAEVEVDANARPPAVQMNMVFSRLSLQSLFQPLTEKFGKDNVSAGLIGGRLKFSGRGHSMQQILSTSQGEAGFGMEGGRLSQLLLELAGLDLFRSAGLVIKGDKPVDVNCVVSDFDMKNGVLQTRDMLIDTDITAVRGEGTINLAEETLDMQLKFYPKDPSPLSARSPILVRGRLKHPKVGVDVAALAARGGVAAALGVLLTPVGALLAFVEPGSGEKENGCAAFVQDLQKRTKGAIPKNPQP